MIGIEDLDEQDLRDVAEFYVRLAARAKNGGCGKETHSTRGGHPTDRHPPAPLGTRSDALPSGSMDTTYDDLSTPENENLDALSSFGNRSAGISKLQE